MTTPNRSAVLLDWADQLQVILDDVPEAGIEDDHVGALVLMANGMRNLAADIAGTSCDSPVGR